MKIITKKEQIIAGVKVNIYHVTGQSLLDGAYIENVNNSDVKIIGWSCPFNFSSFIFELLSYPERRKLTWEYAKSKIDEWPIKVYCGEWSYNLECANPKFAYLGYECGCHYWTDEERVFFIDPPHPEVEDVAPPWEVEKEPAQPTEPDDKVKRLWWYSRKDRHGGMTDFPMTEKEFIEDVLNCGYADKYAPGPIVPDESEWKEVK